MYSNVKRGIRNLLQEGTVIPALPLALDTNRNLDYERQRLLTQYYIASGARGIAVGVHTTQFEIRDQDVALFEPVLKLASEEVEKAHLERPFIKIAVLSVLPIRLSVKQSLLHHRGLIWDCSAWAGWITFLNMN